MRGWRGRGGGGVARTARSQTADTGPSTQTKWGEKKEDAQNEEGEQRVSTKRKKKEGNERGGEKGTRRDR